MAVAGLILLIDAELVKSSIDKILHPQSPDISVGTIAVLIISIVTKLWMSSFFRNLGKRSGSVTLIATAVDSRNDVIATSSVLLGCLVNYFFSLNIDGYIVEQITSGTSGRWY